MKPTQSLSPFTPTRPPKKIAGGKSETEADSQFKPPD